MKPPASAKIYITPSSKYWFEDGILYIASIKSPQPELKARAKQMEELKKRVGDRKICGVVDLTDSPPFSKETREYNNKMLPLIFDALAVIAKSPAAKMIANLYLGLEPVPFPVKVFNNEYEAKNWILKQKARKDQEHVI